MYGCCASTKWTQEAVGVTHTRRSSPYRLPNRNHWQQSQRNRPIDDSAQHRFEGKAPDCRQGDSGRAFIAGKLSDLPLQARTKEARMSRHVSPHVPTVLLVSSAQDDRTNLCGISSRLRPESHRRRRWHARQSHHRADRLCICTRPTACACRRMRCVFAEAVSAGKTRLRNPSRGRTSSAEPQPAHAHANHHRLRDWESDHHHIPTICSTTTLFHNKTVKEFIAADASKERSDEVDYLL
jgi:hypothetical protein